MKRPPFMIALAGSPVGSVMLLCVYGAIVMGWYGGRLQGWLALLATVASIRTLAAVAEVRRYKAWQAEWNALAADAPLPVALPKQGGVRRAMRWAGAGVIAFVLIPYFIAPSTTCTLLWLADSLFMAGALVTAGMRAMQRSQRAAPKEVTEEVLPKVEPVAWLVGRAVYSPSRADATRSLPEYSVRLLQARSNTA